MKYKINKQELKECITEAVLRVLKEDEWDDMLNNALASNKNKKKAEKAAQKDIDNEISTIKSDEKKIEDLENDNFEDDIDNNPLDLSPEHLPYEVLISKPKNINQERQFKTELIKRERIKKEYDEDGIKTWGYEIDSNGHVQPTHSTLGIKTILNKRR